MVKTVYLGLGSNLGNKKQNIRNAVKMLRRQAVVSKMSSFYKTKPVGYADQPDFLNAVAELKTGLTPLQLLRLAKSIERRLGRQRTFRDGPRLIDLDILLYEGRRIKTRKLTIPHQRMNKRKFVLAPLKEIAPDLDRKVFKWKK